MAYYIKDDHRIESEILEIDVVSHCNLSCRACSHLSPISKTRFSAPEAIEKSLRILAKSYHAHTLRLLGGEPLLHPLLTEIVLRTISTGIADKIKIVTNGILLGKTSDDLWKLIDVIEISSYPGFEISTETLNKLYIRGKEFGVDIENKTYKFFRESHSGLGTDDIDLIRRIYSTCQIAHQWGCHSVHEGYFYKCPQSHTINQNSKDLFKDGIPLDGSSNLSDQLKEYLASGEPLRTCAKCLGSVGLVFSHEQLKRKTWEDKQKVPLENLVDWDFLEHLENINPDEENGCYT